jgi:hypothetical protein
MAKKKIVEEKVEEITTKISGYEVKIDQADGVITKLWNLLKKHWGKLLIFLLIYGGYRFVMAVSEEMDKPKQGQVIPIQEESTEGVINNEPFLVREYDEVQGDGSTAVIQVWSDSVETLKKY